MLKETRRVETRKPADCSDGVHAAIDAKGLLKVYRGEKGMPDKQALNGIDLAVPRGSIFGLLGPNGAGKSTFINILAGLVTKTSGSATIWGYDIDTRTRQARASIGVVPQEINIDVFFTPAEALNLQAGLYGVPKREWRTMEILEAVGLADKADAYVRTLSGGMKRRLLVAKAMVHNPPVLILDEPTAGVDIELRRQLWDHVVELNQRGTTIVLTTHYLEEAEALCDTIAIINNGSVVACEKKPDLLSRMDEKTLLVRPDTKICESQLASLDLSYEVRADGTLAIFYSPRHHRVGRIITGLREAGIGIADLTTEQADLEDIFMQLTYNAEESS